MLPSDLKKVIADTYTVSEYCSVNSEQYFELVDKLYLLSFVEVIDSDDYLNWSYLGDDFDDSYTK